MKKMLSEQGLSDNIEMNNISYEKETVYYKSSFSSTWSKYATGESVLRDKWLYNLYNDNWDYIARETLSGTFNLTKELEGKWKADRNDEFYITIKNVQNNSLEIEYYGKCYTLYLTEGKMGNDWLSLVFSKHDGGLVADTVSIYLPSHKTDDGYKAYEDIKITISIDIYIDFIYGSQSKVSN